MENDRSWQKVDKERAGQAPHNRELQGTQPFPSVLEISVGIQEAHTRFINLVNNLVFENFVETDADRKLQAYWCPTHGAPPLKSLLDAEDQSEFHRRSGNPSELH